MASKKSKKSNRTAKSVKASKSCSLGAKSWLYILVGSGIFCLAWMAMRNVVQNSQQSYDLEYGVLVIGPLVLVAVLILNYLKKSK